MDTFRIVLPAERSRLRGARHELGEWCDAVGIDGSTRDSIVLATHEAISALIQDQRRSIQVSASLRDDTVTIEVAGSGRESPDGAHQPRQEPQLSLIRATIDHVEIHSDENRTVIRLAHSL